jgi:hypothetical protein
MLGKWIIDNERVNHDLKSNIKIFDLLTNNLSENILIDIAKRVLISLCDPEDIKYICDGENIDYLENYVKNHVIPDKNSDFYPRKSFWGEIISAEILKDFRNHCIPIYKLRHKEKRNASMRSGADIVTCVKHENKVLIALSEVKTKGNIAASGIYKYRCEIEKAYTQLKKNDINEPEIIDYMIKILRYEGKNELAKLFKDDFKNFTNTHREFHIFMVMEKIRWDEDILRLFRNESINLPNLTINILLINDINKLIEDTYELIPKIAEEVINE